MQRWFGRKATTEPSPLAKETKKVEEAKVNEKMVEVENNEETTTARQEQNDDNIEQNGQEEQPQVRLRNGRGKSRVVHSWMFGLELISAPLL